MTKKLTYKEIKEVFEQYELKLTHQRMVIYQCLYEKDSHPTADEIYNKIKKTNPTISLGTIYKTLDIFVEKALVKKFSTADESKTHYDANMEMHDHLYCKKTKQIMDYKDKALKDLIASYFAKKAISNFKIEDIQVQINGEKINSEDEVKIH